MLDIIYIFIGLLIGSVAGWLIFRAKLSAVKIASDEKLLASETLSAERLSDKEKRITELQSEVNTVKADISALNDRLNHEIELRSSAERTAAHFTDLKKQYDQSQNELSQLKADMAELQARAQETAKNADEKIKLIQSARQEMTDSFKALSAEALKNNNQSFVEIAGDKMINPMRETLTKVDTQLRELEKNRTQAYAGLFEQVKNLSEGQKQLNNETSSLVQALRRPEGRGRWGEMQLQRVAELAGMMEYCDFVTQDSVRDSDGKLQRPDMIVNLPGDKTIVVDSKVSLSAYLEALETTDPEKKEQLMHNHARQVREHFKQLGQKSYWSNYNGSPEFVVLFIPGEAFFSAAIERDPQLIEYGIDRNVIIATPTTLIAMLKAVAYGWRQEKVADNARKISELGQELYERICVMSSHFENLRKGLEKAVSSYNSTIGTFEKRVLVSARRFNELGLPSKKSLPDATQLNVIPGQLTIEEGPTSQN